MARVSLTLASPLGHTRSRLREVDWRSAREPCAVVSILLLAGLLYAWKLDQNGWANAYYSAAVQAGRHDPIAFIFGSSDWGNSITVDKPPLSLWVMGLSVQLFGLSSWSLLLPQALMTVGSTFLIYKIVRTVFPAYVALLASGVFAFAPITVLLARYNNPDPLMILLMLAALYATVRATTDARPRLLYFAALLLGLGFLTKQLQAFLVLPALVAIFATFVRIPWRKRLLAVAWSGCILLSVSLAWPLAVDLTPAAARPFVGGSTRNSMLELTLGYNGIDRVLQHEDAPSVSLIPEAMRGVDSDAGFFRLFNSNYGQEIGWLLAPGLLGCATILWCLATRRFSRGQSILSGAAAIWMSTTYLMLSFMGNNFHSYYTASLAPPLALTIGIGAYVLVDFKKTIAGRLASTLVLIVSYIFANAMWRLGSGLDLIAGQTILVLGLVTAALLTVPSPWRKLERIVTCLAIAGLLVGPIACALATAATPQAGSNPLSGSTTRNRNTLSHFLDGVKRNDPAWASGIAIGRQPSSDLVRYLQQERSNCEWAAATYPGQTAAQFQLAVDRPVMPLGGFAAVDPSPSLGQFKDWVRDGRICFLIRQEEQLKVPGNSSELLAIEDWVEKTYESEVIDGFTTYRLVP